ncbi:MAG TPA: hypothetical protein VG293_10660 [Solirubrobacteraceae bacterium]|nr:hypothetical protein [Solirubrobacteraceae bacterium]
MSGSTTPARAASLNSNLVCEVLLEQLQVEQLGVELDEALEGGGGVMIAEETPGQLDMLAVAEAVASGQDLAEDGIAARAARTYR